MALHFVSVDHARDKDLAGYQPDVLLCRPWETGGLAGGTVLGLACAITRRQRITRAKDARKRAGRRAAERARRAAQCA